MSIGGSASGQEPIPGSRQSTIWLIAIYAVLTIFAVQTVYPILWMIFGSLKSNEDLFTNIWGPPAVVQWANYPAAWEIGSLGTRIGNSMLVTAASIMLLLVVATPAAYALARLALPGGKVLFLAILALMMVPPQTTLIPLFLIVKNLGLLNSRLGLILVYAATGAAFSIFVLRAFFLSIPAELEDAALVDGANRFQVFLQVILPLARPGLATIAIFQGMEIWNEFFLAFIFIRDPERQTIPLGLVEFFSRYQSEWTLYFAALTTITLPVIVLYVAMQRQFIAGLTAGALKG
ncbi:MAG: carbohydrate ABC transporter permease [Thermomicrobiales bacterium]